VRVPVRGGDLLVLATDGLFDNVAEEEVLEVIEASAAQSAAEEPERLGVDEHALATALATRAYERSLDREVDSPFALLAKDNDIMWGGGRPDDITVIVARIDVPAAEPEAAVSGPGQPPAALLTMEAQERQRTRAHSMAEANYDWD
jgi:protein phosphatase PTC7